VKGKVLCYLVLFGGVVINNQREAASHRRIAVKNCAPAR
jgi:hypothetical protein